MQKEPLAVYEFNPYKIPDEYHKAIGQVVTCASQTESILGDFLSSILRIDLIEAMALTINMGNPLKMSICRTLIELNAATSNIIDEVDDILDEIEQAQKKRNIIVHNRLGLHPVTNEVYSHRYSARGSVQVELKIISVDEFEQVALALYNSGMRLLLFMRMRNITPRDRTTPVHAPLNRKKKARSIRKENLNRTRRCVGIKD